VLASSLSLKTKCAWPAASHHRHEQYISNRTTSQSTQHSRSATRCCSRCAGLTALTALAMRESLFCAGRALSALLPLTQLRRLTLADLVFHGGFLDPFPPNDGAGSLADQGGEGGEDVRRLPQSITFLELDKVYDLE
jgi:hypothetical protein